MPLSPGSKLGSYEVLAPLGAGGMGEVYRARDTRLGRDVALKVLPADRLNDESRRRRFIHEARAASALNHPNIVTIYEIESANGIDFIVMEYVPGKTLEALLRPGMRLGDALKLAIPLADALARAHAAGIVHRDLKPSNVVVSDEGVVKVLDFGLAKLVADGEPSADGETASAEAISLSRPGTVAGTPGYMSPEQVRGGKVDARSDVFAFGALLYEMVTGRRAFARPSAPEMLAAVLREEPQQPSALVPGLPSQLEKLIQRCLRKEPERRSQHMSDVKVELEQIKEELGSRSITRPPGRQRPWLVAALVAVALAAALLWRARGRYEGGGHIAGAIVSGPLQATPLTTFPGVENYPSLSPEGNYVVFMWTGPKQDNADIYVQMIGSSGPPLQLTTDPQSDYNPVWSPDGRWIAFLRAPPDSGPGTTELRLIPPLGGSERKLTDIKVPRVGHPGFLAWSPDATALIAADSPAGGTAGALYVIALETGEKRQLTSPPPNLLGDCQPAVSPDGSSLVFRRVHAYNIGELYLLPLGRGLTASGEPRRLTLGRLDAAYPAWLPGGDEILFSNATRAQGGLRAGGGLWRLAVSGEKAQARLPFVGEAGSMPVVSRSQPGKPSRLVYARRIADANIWRLDTPAPGAPASSPPLAAISSTRVEIVGHLSPDGRRVAFGSDRSGEFEVWLADLDGSHAVQLTSMTSAMAAAPRWSPDGQLVAFHSNLEGQSEIYVIPAAGGKPRRITSHPANDNVPSFSRDGRSIYFASLRSGVISNAFDVVERGVYYIDQPSGQASLKFFDFATERSTTIARGLGEVGALLTAPCRACCAGSSASGASCCSTSRSAPPRPWPSTSEVRSERTPGPASWPRSPRAATWSSGIRTDTCS